MKNIITLLLAGVLLFSLVACNATGDPTGETTPSATVTTEAPDGSESPDSTTSEPDSTTEKPEGTTPAPTEGISKDAWASMLSYETFDNYTYTMEGEMTSTSAAGTHTTYAKQIYKITADKLLITVESEGVITALPVYEGDIVAAQKEQMADFFRALLEDYENFVYDSETNSYKLPETVTIETVAKAITALPDGSFATAEIPTKYELREAEIVISEDGKLVSLVCDYSQTMTTEIGEVTSSGITTWTFSDFGTTVIE